MRYLVAMAISCLMVGVALSYHRWVASSVGPVTANARARAGLPPPSPMNDLIVPVTGRQMLYIELDHFLVKFWYVLVPAVVLLCFGVAASFPRAPSTVGIAPNSSHKP